MFAICSSKYPTADAANQCLQGRRFRTAGRQPTLEVRRGLGRAAQAGRVGQDAASLRRLMRVTRRRTAWADQDPRPESVGILRAVSAAARALGDVMPLARSLVRMGASSAARASARSHWALLPGLMRANCFTSVPDAVHQSAASDPGRAAAEIAMRSTRALAVATGRPIEAANRSASWSRYPTSVIPSAGALGHWRLQQQSGSGFSSCTSSAHPSSESEARLVRVVVDGEQQ